MTEQGEIEPAVRASHGDRERAVRRLEDAMAQGRLDALEFSERSGAALLARTQGELAKLTSDLPAPAGGQDTVELTAKSSHVQRKGEWVVPRILLLTLTRSSAQLDFTRARIDHPVVTIDLDASGSSVEIRLPDGASVTTDDVETSHSSIEDHRRNVPPDGTPRFVFVGEVHRASLEIRGPRRFLRGRKKD
jgi:hypothetical protein